MPEISVVTTLYYSERYIRKFYDRIRVALEQITKNYEIIFVDDGSPDSGTDEVIKIIGEDSKVRLIELSRNFGHHSAIMVGLEHTQGELVFLIDVDLEEEPELLLTFSEKMNDNPKLDVVYAFVKHRKGNIFKRVLGWCFYKIINILSEVKIPHNTLVARLMKRNYVNNVVRFSEKHLFLGGIFQLTGFQQEAVETTKHSKGFTTYSLFRRFQQALNAILSFSDRPLIFTSILGILISITSSILILYLLISFVFFNRFLPGWVSTIASIWFVGGIILSAIGLVGLYISKIFIEVKGRPRTIIKKAHNFLKNNQD